MHVEDAGQACDGTLIVRFRCGHCGYVSDWMKQRSIAEEKRGRPCPICAERAE